MRAEALARRIDRDPRFLGAKPWNFLTVLLQRYKGGVKALYLSNYGGVPNYGHAPHAAAILGDEDRARRLNKRKTPGGTAGQLQAGVGSSPTPGAAPTAPPGTKPRQPDSTVVGPVPAGVKFDGGKNRLGLLPPRALEAVGRVLSAGAEKYTARDADGNVTRDGAQNWRKVPELQRRYTDAALRHIVADMRGEEADPETGSSHLAHAICCLLFRLEDRLMKEAGQ